MSKKDSQLLIDSLARRWVATHSPSAGTTCVAQAPAAVPGGMHYLDALGFSAVQAGGPAQTLVLTVRDSSIAGAVKAQYKMWLPATASVQDTWAVKEHSIAGDTLFVEFGTPNASVVQTINLAGWTEEIR